MRFYCDGRMYVAAEMRSFRTGDPTTPLIFLTRDGRATFVVNRQTDGTLSAHSAATGEIIALSRRHNVAGLLGAFPSTFAPARIMAENVESHSEWGALEIGSDSAMAGMPCAGIPRAGVFT